MDEWGTLLNDTARSLFLDRVDRLYTPRNQVVFDPATGLSYVEGQPIFGRTGLAQDGKPSFQVTEPMMLIGGGLLALGLLIVLLK